MDAARYQRLKKLLFEANRLPESERAGFLDRACADDPQLRREVGSLLKGADVETVDLQQPVEAVALRTTDFPEPPWHCGPYRVEREVGRGGMGVVFEARDLGTDERVALKLIPPLFAEAPRLGDRFTREAEIGLRIDHPHVVRTLDFGQVTVRGRAVPYLVMEFVEGENLRELLAKLGVVPESLLREIAEQVSRGLAEIHARGIVHRDLKPENVIIATDRTVRIMDLGIAKLHDATHELTREGQFLGSLHYAAPEQCGGADVGPPADLYALGVLLHELATGENPFRRDNPAAVIHAHLDFVAPPIPDISPFFGELIRTLLAKDPADRFADGAELARVLVAGERGTWWATRRREGGPRGPAHLDVPRRTPLVGRETELAALRDAWDRARKGAGSTVLVGGEAGIGKSRLVDEFLRTAGSGVHVLCGSFRPGAGLAAIADAVLTQFPAARVEEALEPYFPDATVLRSTFAALVRGEAVPEGRGELVQSATTRLLEGLAAERPVLWVLEDVHHAPEAAWRVVQALSRTAARLPAMLVLTARALPPEARLGPLIRTDRFTRIELGRLPPAEIGALVEAALGDDANGTRAQDVARKSDGNPLFALAMLQPGGADADSAVPSEIHDLIAARLADLDRDERTTLDAAAVQGAEFDAELLAGMLGLPVVGLLQDLAELERRRGIVRAVGRRYRFDHGLVQEVLYAQLPERLRAEYHTRLADAYAHGVEGEPWGVQAEFLARHYLEGVEPGRALPHVAAALEHLANRYLHEDAIQLIDRALAVGDLDERERIGLLERKESMQFLLGRREERRATITEMLERADRLGDTALRAAARRSLGAWHHAAGREPEALEAYERAIELAREAGDAALECRARTQGGIALARMRREDEALEAHRHALRIAKELGNRGLEAYAMVNIGQVLRHLCRYREARETFERVIAIARELDDEGREMSAHGALGIAETELGHWDRAERHLLRVIEFGRRVGSRQYESPATGNLGLVRIHQGRIEDALDCCRRHRAFAIELGARRSEAVATASLGRIEMLLGNAARARPLLMEAREMADGTHARQLVAEYDLNLGRLALSEGEPARARPHLEASVDGFRAIRHPDYMARALIELAACDAGEGRPDDAKPRLDEALAIGEDLDLPALRFGALVLLGDEEGARAIDAESGERISIFERLVGRARMGWTAGARELLERLVESAPAEEREAMVARTPLYRSIW